MSEDYESLVDLDESALDREWLRQPKLYMTFALQLAQAKLEHVTAKANLDVVRAEMELKVRDTPTDYDINKVTEAVISAVVETQPKVKRAVHELNIARHRVDVLEAIVNTLEHRKRTLENLVTLHGQNYFSTPRASKEGQDKLNGQIKQGARKPLPRRNRDRD